MPSKSDHKFHVLYLGLVTQSKGIYDLLEVLKQGKELYEGKLVLHVGGNGEIDYLKTLIKEYDLENIVIYEGWLDSEMKNEMMNKCSIFILPSYAEGMPVSVLEALSYGHYIIATNVGGVPEIVNDEVGVLITPGDQNALSTVLNQILTAKISLPDKNFIRKKTDEYLPKRIASALDEVYSKYL